MNAGARPALGVVLILLASVLFATMEALVRLASAVVPVLLLASPLPLASLLPALEPAQRLLRVAIGACGSFGHLLPIVAIGQAPTATLMPFLHAQIARAALLARGVAGHVPDGWAWLGMSVVAPYGAASAWLNLRVPRRASALDADPVADRSGYEWM